MTKELLVRCTACLTNFIAEIPDQWTEEDLRDRTKDIFSPDQPQNCDLHPKRGTFETLVLDADWLKNKLRDPQITREVALPVYREGRRKKTQG